MVPGTPSTLTPGLIVVTVCVEAGGAVANEPGTPDTSKKQDDSVHAPKPHSDDSGGVHFGSDSRITIGRDLIGRDAIAYGLVALAVPLVPFFKSFMSKAGEDAYLGLRNFVRDRLKARGDDRLILEDTETHLQVELTTELPDQAFQQLLQVEPAELARPDGQIQARLRWDASTGHWAPPS